MSRQYPITMPDLGEGVVEGEVQKWFVSPGDLIQEDQVLVEVMTDKAVVEVPSSVSGRVKELKIKKGQTCPVGEALLIVETSEKVKDVQKNQKESASVLQIKDEEVVEKKVQKDPPPLESKLKVLAVPLVRRKAKEWGVDLNTIKGTGLAGRVTLDDLKKVKPQTLMESDRPAFSGFSVPSEGPESRVSLKGIRKKIADKMQLSKNVIPHFTLMDQASVEELYRLKNQSKNLYPDVKVTYLSFIMKILYQCVLDFPEFNASIDSHSEEIVYKKYYNFGVAVDTPKGLLVPVVKDVNRKSVVEISRDIVELAQRARDSKITVDEMKGATITITNIGSISGQWATPIINPPEVSILGMYRVFEQPVWKGDSFRPIRTMNFSLTSDHRLIDGAVAARFMSQFIERVENPSLILLES